jgi:hypothetical protein
MVCGQTQPQNNLPNAAVNKTIKMTKQIMVRPKMKKSCGQKTFPNNMNLASGILNKNKGLPLIYTNGRAMKSIKNNQLTMLL